VGGAVFVHEADQFLDDGVPRHSHGGMDRRHSGDTKD
jgi:hypothetical protein